MRAEFNFMFIHGEVGDAAPELEESLARIAIAFVLLDSVGNRLLRETVF